MLSLLFCGQEVDLRPNPISKTRRKFKLKPSKMKKFLAVIAIASFVACNNEGDSKTTMEDSLKRVDSMRVADSIANANKMMTQPKVDSPAMKTDSPSTKK